MKELERAIEKLDKFISALPISVGWDILDPLCECAELLKETRAKLCRAEEIKDNKSLVEEDLKIAIDNLKYGLLEYSLAQKNKVVELYSTEIEIAIRCMEFELERRTKNPMPKVYDNIPTSQLLKCCLADCDNCEYEQDCDSNFEGYSKEVAKRLQVLIDIEENKPLELSELKKMVGKPVWVDCEEPHWIIIEKVCINENCLNVLSQNHTWYTDIKIKFDVINQFEGVDNCKFYAYPLSEED